MNGNFLLDTNIVIALFAAEKSVIDHLATARDVNIPSIVIGELYYGARKSDHIKENLARIDELIRRTTIITCDLVTAFHYGDIKNQLRQKGKPIPENDIWIAAMAAQYKFRLITRDDHFIWVHGLSLEHW